MPLPLGEVTEPPLFRPAGLGLRLRSLGLAVAAGVLFHALLLYFGLVEWGYVSIVQAVMHVLLPLALALALGPWQPRPRPDAAEPAVPTGLVAGGLGVVATTLDFATIINGELHLEWLASQGLPGLASLGLSVWLLRQCRPWVSPTERKRSLVALGLWVGGLAVVLAVDRWLDHVGASFF